MANMLENYGLEMFRKDEEAFSGLVGFALSEGKCVSGYYGTPYIYKRADDVEFWVSTTKRADGNFEVEEVNTHCGNPCLWELRHSGIDLTPKDANKNKRLIVFNRNDSTGGSFPIEIINADVLPSFMQDDIIEAQIVALPLEINYYDNEDEYAEAQPAAESGKKWLLAMGSMAALNFIYNHDPSNYDPEKEYESDSYVEFVAKVKKLYHGSFEINGEKYHTFIRCIAETNYGEIEFDHTIDMVPEEQQDKVKVGAIIHGICMLSGDVAIKDYEDGIVKDFDNDLKLMKYTFAKGDPERIRNVLAENAVYESDHSKETYIGAQEIIDKIKYVQENRGAEYSAYFATITAVDDENVEYPIGTKCLVLSSDEGETYESIAFISVNEEGLILKIKISTDSKYHFFIDTIEEIKTPLDDIKLPDSVFELIIARAKYHDIIDFDTEESSVVKNIRDYNSLKNNAERMLEALKENSSNWKKDVFGNILGYLFAKAIEQNENEKDDHLYNEVRLTASYVPEEAFRGEITSTLSEEKHDALIKAMELGKQFDQDLRSFCVMKNIGADGFDEIFCQTAIVVQRLGQMYAEKCFD